MILIQSVEARSFPDRDAVELYDTFMNNNHALISNGIYQKEAEVYMDLIKSQKFRNPKTGEVIAIGNSPEVQSLIGLQFEVYENLKEQINYRGQLIADLRATIEDEQEWSNNMIDDYMACLKKLMRIKKIEKLRRKRYKKIIKNMGGVLNNEN